MTFFTSADSQLGSRLMNLIEIKNKVCVCMMFLCECVLFNSTSPV